MNRDKIKNVSSDFELLSLLEAAVEEKEAAAAEQVEEEVPAEAECEGGECAGANVVLSPDGTVQAQNATADVVVDPSKTVQISVTESYSDAFLLNLLEENGFDTSYSNLKMLKEGLKNGTITLEEKAKEEVPAEEPVEEEVVEEAPAEEEQPVEEEVPAEEGAPRVQITMPVDGSMVIDNQGKQIQSDPQGNITVALAEAKALRTTEKFLRSYLIEDCDFDKDEYNLLTEEVKTDGIREIARQLLAMLEEKLSGIDTSVPDRSRGDIKQLKELPVIQDSLTKLESILEREDDVNREYVMAVNIVIRSILYINQYSSVFKDAYRNKKTVMIMRYQSLVLAVISSISYIVATLIQAKNGNLVLRDSIEGLLEFAPLQALEKFVKSVDTGEFKRLVSDADTLREYFLEIPVEKMSTILEASDYLPMIIDGVKNIYNSLASDGKITGLLYKVVGVIVTLFSLRDVFYSIFRMKTKISDMLGQLNIFANIGNGVGNPLGKLSQYASKFVADAESGSDLAKKEIDTENKRLASGVRQAQVNSMNIAEPVVKVSKAEQSPAPATSDSIFGFDF
jgi:hypothetical protein